MILAFDLATNTGWCAGTGADLPQLGSVRMPDTKEEIGPFGDFFLRWVLIHLDEIQPTMVVFEAPVLPKVTNMATTLKLQGLAVLLEVACFQKGVPVRQTHVGTVKVATGGHGRATKEDTMAGARRCGLAPKTYDEADAFGVWIVGLRAYARQFQHIWDQRLYGGRPGNLQL